MSLLFGAGVGLMAVNSFFGQKAANAALKYQAAQNRINAKLARMQAESALRQGEKQQQQIMIQGEKLKGAQKTAYAASNVDLKSRSAQNVLNSTDYLTEVDKNQAATNALEQAWQSRIQATNYENDANIALSQQQSAWGAALTTAGGLALMNMGATKALGSSISDAFSSGMDWAKSTFGSAGLSNSVGGLASVTSGGYSPTLLGSATGLGRTWSLQSSMFG